MAKEVEVQNGGNHQEPPVVKDDDGERRLPAGLQLESMPEHVAFIMDGNRRWAKERGLPAIAGHTNGAQCLINIVNICLRWKIKAATCYSFSSENWNRPDEEVELLMQLIGKTLQDEVECFHKKGVKASVIGDTSLLPKFLQEIIKDTEERTRHNSRFHLILALSYSGQDDIVEACRSIGKKVKDGLIEPKDVNRSIVEQELQTKRIGVPNPDLLIRTGGELRISNFLLWQAAYTELYFADELWPDFGMEGFTKAISCFQQRRRRFGK
ncbi:hypothetical protein Nepgr_024828 [Nepenthes gracilis]|uniref:Alkyl transferase n=1 Tax=Nepenthes gracilis TaxID=150966 RepID=A0AAD3T3Y4_NEPGR|nr:hypothetical protein Nepgr_024828 [Nepenthes gracilis]